jgi:hypothetical protein
VKEYLVNKSYEALEIKEDPDLSYLPIDDNFHKQ